MITPTVVSATVCAVSREVGARDDDRHAQREQRGGVAQPPREAHPARAAGAAAIARDERGDRGQVVRVGGVAQPQQDRDEDHGAEHGAVAQLGELLVKTEHRASPDMRGTGP